MVNLADGRSKSAYADSVAAHDGDLGVAVLVEVGHAHALSVLGAELEDVADLDAAGDGDVLLAAARADSALDYLREIVVLNVLAVAVDVEPGEVVLLLVCAAGEVVGVLERAVEQHGHALGKPYRSDVACVQPAFRSDNGRVDIAAEEVRQLGFVDVEVAADKYDNVAVVVVTLVNYSLAALFLRAVQELADFLDGVDIRSVYLSEGLALGVAGVLDDGLGSFHVSAESAVIAYRDGILADRREQHEFVGNASAHHAGVGLYGDHFGNAGAGVDTLIRLVAAHVVLLKILLGGVEGVRVLHGELADSDKTAAGTCLVAELGLYLVDHERILGVAVRVLADELHCGLLVGHAEDHLRLVAVGEAQQLAADALVSAGFLPEGRGHYYGEGYLLTVDGVHLLADYLLDLAGDALQGHVAGEDAVRNVLHVAAAYHQRVAVDVAVGGALLEAVAY